MEREFRLLMLDDSADDLDLIERKLRLDGIVFTANRVQSKDAFLQALQDFSPHLILSDHVLPGFDGLSALASARKQCPEVPFILVSGMLGEELAIESLKSGATDYVLKDRLGRLVPAVRRALEEVRQREEQQRAQGAVRESEAKFAAFAESIPAIIFVHQEGKFCYVNTAAETILGYSRTELLSMHFWEVLHPEIREEVRNQGVRREQGETLPAQSEFQIISKNGVTRWLACNACRIELGGRPAVLGSAFDISQRKEVEGALRGSEQRFRQVVEQIREVFWMSDPTKDRILYISPAYEEIWGRSCASLYASPRDWLEAIHPEDRDRVWQAAFTKQVSGEFHEVYRIVRPDGTIRWIDDRAFPIRNELGQVYRVTGIAEDVTERKRGEAVLGALCRLGLELSAATTPSDAGQIVVDVAFSLFGCDACYLHLYSPELNQILPVLTMDTLAGQKVNVANTTFTRDPSPMMCEVMCNGARLINRDWTPSTNGEAGVTPAETGFLPLKVDPVPLVRFGDSTRLSASMMYVPIRHGASVIGILSIQSYTPRAYNEKDLATLQGLADHCGGALERIRAVMTVRQNELKNRLLLNAIPHWMFRISKDGTILDYKKPKKFAADAALDLTEKNVFALSPSHLVARFRPCLEKALASDEEQTFEFQYSLQGQVCHFEAQIVASGEAEVVAIVRDVSERKRLEEGILEISTRERRRIGHDLHDGLGQYLAGVAFKAKLLEDSLQSEDSPHLAEAREVVRLINNGIKQARTLAHGCDPVAIAANGLGSALERLAEDTQKVFKITCRAKSDLCPQTVDQLCGSQLYRIAQEAINNAITHGRAKSIQLELAVRSNQLHLTIRDDGQGFVPGTNGDSGMGLRIIRYRAQSIGGGVQIRSQPNQGAEVFCTVPLQRATEAQHRDG